jgi:hypothetical protein
MIWHNRGWYLIADVSRVFIAKNGAKPSPTYTALVANHVIPNYSKGARGLSV